MFLHFDSLLLQYMSVEVLRESTCDCIHEIICKGMEPIAKKKLVESLLIVLEQSGILIPHEVRRLFRFVIVVVSSRMLHPIIVHIYCTCMFCRKFFYNLTCHCFIGG